MKPKHIIIIVVVVILLAAGAAVAAEYAKNKRNSIPTVNPAPAAGGSSGTPEPVALNYSKKLGFGSAGAEVMELQRLYNASSHSPKLVVDGKFGAKTLGGVIKVMGFGTVSVSLADFKTTIERHASQAKDANFLKTMFGL